MCIRDREYVDGMPIDRYAQALSEERKLRLFLQVCSGVQYLSLIHISEPTRPY
mgnify:CR=1 FL=1